MSYIAYAQIVTNANWGSTITDNTSPSGKIWTRLDDSSYTTGGNYSYGLESTSGTTSYISPGSFNDAAPGSNLPSGFSASIIAVYLGTDFVTNYDNYSIATGVGPPAPNALIGGNAFGGCANIKTIQIPSVPTALSSNALTSGAFSALAMDNSVTVTELENNSTNYNTIYQFFYYSAKSPPQGPPPAIAQGYFNTLNYVPGGTPPPPPSSGGIVICFKEGSKIETINGYIPIEEVRSGDLVKTSNHGYVPVNMIGYRLFYNPICEERIKDKLYIYKSSFKHPELFEDLIITGCHSILVDSFKEGEQEQTHELLGKIYITDSKYRLPACVDMDSNPYEVEGDVNIWHIALDNDDDYMNYGIYANGLLVESTCKKHLKELSGMTLV